MTYKLNNRLRNITVRHLTNCKIYQDAVFNRQLNRQVPWKAELTSHLFPVVLIIGSQIWRPSCSYLIVLKSSVTRRKAVNTEWRTMEGDGK